MNINAEIITIGDEILYGQIVDTNSQWISTEMVKSGFSIIRKTSVGDNHDDILGAIQEATSRSKVVLITGGLGPTKDDITKHTIAEFLGEKLTLRQEVLDHIEHIFLSRGRLVNDLNKSQAYVPESGLVLYNRVGTAPGMWFEYQDAIILSMPGVPYEMKTLMSEQILPKLKEKFHTPYIYHKMLRTVGIAESILAEHIESWEDNLPDHIKLAYLPRAGQVRLRLTARGFDLDQLKLEVQQQVESLRPLLGDKLYAEDDIELEEIVAEIFKKNTKTLATAESCTGGNVAHRITQKAGASEFFMGGIVAYDNQIKINHLGVSEETLKEHGAVSEETAKEMAEGVRKRFNTDFGISTTGVAGPGGGTDEKPVGTVWIGYADQYGAQAKLLKLTSDRHININASSNAVLQFLLKNMKEE